MKKQAVWGGAALTAAATASILLTAENKRLCVAAYEVESAALPALFDGVRLLHISDLHAASFGRDQKKLLRLIDGLQADMALLTGDLIDRRRVLDEAAMAPALTLLRGLSERMPTLRVEGNHEARSCQRARFTELAAQTGAQNVTERAVTVRRQDAALTLLGIPDLAAEQDNMVRWQQRLHALCAPHAGDYCVALAHRPQFLPLYAQEGVALVLSGHAHGGQVRLPLFGGLYAPEQGVLPRYTAGCYTQGDTQMVVSRGLGNSRFPLRFGNRPEIGLITLKCATLNEETKEGSYDESPTDSRRV